jgi:CTP:molybdopterin cytidylyltransferase MocA
VTVAALILCATTESAIADTDGRAAVRRMVESAWAGGAVPIVVVAPEQDGVVAAALTGSPAVLAEPAPAEGGPVAQIRRAFAVARERVTDTEAGLVWPGAMVWVDPETVTSLIEAYGVRAGTILRPQFGDRSGWPVLLPIESDATLAASTPDRMPDDLIADLVAKGATVEELPLGDPGTTHSRATRSDDLPPYEGPAVPAGGPPPEWGAPVGERPEDVALEGPSLAPYAQAEAETE